MNLTEILESHGVIIKEGKVEASSFAINVIGSKSDKLYINKLPTDKKLKIDGKYWISINYSKELMENSKMKKAKEIFNKLNEKQIIKTESIITQTKQILENKIDIENCYINYQGKDINIILTEKNEVYYKGVDVAEVLEYADPHDAIKTLINEKYIKSYQEIKKNNNVYGAPKKVNSQTIYLTIDGIKELISKSKKPKSIELAKEFNIEIINCKNLYKEQITINDILNSFLGEKIKLQYPVGRYFIDLYFLEYNLAIECDENNHSDRDVYYENEREKYIKNNLNCTFIRFNPDEKNFKIENIINKIFKKIKDFIENKKNSDKYSEKNHNLLKELNNLDQKIIEARNRKNIEEIKLLELEVESKRLDLAKIEAETKRLQLEIELIKLRNNKTTKISEMKELEDKSVEYFLENNITKAESTEFIYATELYEKYDNTTMSLELFVKEIKKIKPEIIYKGKTKDGITRKAFFGIKFIENP
jgi:very-short-patch-repair endonuclease